MNKKNLFSIGEVPNLFYISVSSLRHYEIIGLLTPKYISPKSGYRYYGTEQFEVLNTIRYLRALDMPETLCVRLRFRGCHAESGVHYKRLLEYIDNHSMQICGFSREVTLVDYGITNDTEKFVTEICIPIKC